MHNLYVSDIIKLCNGTLLNGNPDLLLTNFCTDTRKIKPNDVYVAIKGETFNGNKFYQEAIKKGASVCILDNVEDDYNYQNTTVVLVENTITCLQQLATYKRTLYNIPVIAVTGSVGKTSTKDIIASVMEQKYKTCKTIGNYNNHIGVPLTILSLKDEEALVIEMGMNHLNEISVLSNIAKPTIAIITNVGTAHIGNLGNRENILKAKLEILDGMIENTCIFNADNDMLNKVINKYNALTYAIDTPSTWQATNIKENIFSSTFDIKDKIKNINVNVGGKAFIYNSLVAYAIGEILHIDESLIKKGIENFKLSSGRLEKKITNQKVTIIDDTYNANYDSMKSSIELLGKVTNKRKIAILGDMLELGDYTKELHNKIGEVIHNNNIDILITIGNYSTNIETKAIELGMNKNNCYHFSKQDECYNLVSNLFTSNDIVLLKGSHSIHLDKVVDYLMK